MARYKNPNTGEEFVYGGKMGAYLAKKKGMIPMDQGAITEWRKQGFGDETYGKFSEDKFVSEAMGDMPDYPGYESLGSTPFDEILPEEFQMKTPESLLPFLEEQYAPAKESLGELKDYSQSTELSPFAQSQMDRQMAEEELARDMVPQTVAGDIANARSSLAMRGGLEGGAGERLATAGMRASQEGIQNVGGEGRLARLGIGEAEAGRKYDIFKGMPAAEMQLASPFAQQGVREQQYEQDARRFNLDAVMRERENKRKANLDKFGSAQDRAMFEGSLRGSFNTAATQPGSRPGEIINRGTE